MKIKPAPGFKVRDPVTLQHLPDEGAEVQPSAYWYRRMRAGEVVEVAPEPEPVVTQDPIPDSTEG